MSETDKDREAMEAGAQTARGKDYNSTGACVADGFRKGWLAKAKHDEERIADYEKALSEINEYSYKVGWAKGALGRIAGKTLKRWAR